MRTVHDPYIGLCEIFKVTYYECYFHLSRLSQHLSQGSRSKQIGGLMSLPGMSVNLPGDLVSCSVPRRFLTIAVYLAWKSLIVFYSTRMLQLQSLLSPPACFHRVW